MRLRHLRVTLLATRRLFAAVRNVAMTLPSTWELQIFSHGTPNCSGMSIAKGKTTQEVYDTYNSEVAIVQGLSRRSPGSKDAPEALGAMMSAGPFNTMPLLAP